MKIGYLASLIQNIQEGDSKMSQMSEMEQLKLIEKFIYQRKKLIKQEIIKKKYENRDTPDR